MGIRNGKIVITVPEHFNSSQRNATICAAELAGLTVMGLINEPTAAALAYSIKQNEPEIKYVLVFDLSGETFDVSLLAVGNNIIEVKRNGGNRYLGSKDFVNKMVDYFIEQVKDQFEVDTFSPYKDIESIQKIRDVCEIAKRTLSSNSKKLINLCGIFPDASSKPLV